MLCSWRTIDAFEVQQVGSVVYLVQLETHLHQVACYWVLPPNTQVVRVHHLNITHIKRNPRNRSAISWLRKVRLIYVYVTKQCIVYKDHCTI